MSAITAGLEPGTLRVRTRIVSSETISEVCIPARGPRPQERAVDALRQQLVASGVGRFENVRKVMKPFRAFFILLRINFRRGTAKEVAHNTTLMAINGKSDAPRGRQREDRGLPGRSRPQAKPTYIDRHHFIANHRR